MEQINWIEWIGYAASVIVAISLLMTSIIKLRILNLIGAIVFIIYGFLIHAMPIVAINFVASLINCYHLYKMISAQRA